MSSQDDETADEYRAWLDSWAAPATVKARHRLARTVLAEWGGVEGVTVENVQRFLGRSKPDGSPMSAWTRATYHANMSDFCDWLVATDRLEDSPMERVPSVKRPKYKPRPLSDAQMRLVLDTATGRVRDWILLAYLAGLRAHEVAKIRGEDVTEEYIYVQGKGGVREEIACHPDLWAMAQRYPTRGYWFPGIGGRAHVVTDSITMAVGKLFDELGIDGAIHRVRHSYATKLLREGVHMRRVQQLMRHASVETTAAYTAVDEDELRAAINMLPRIPPPPTAA